jgi:Fic family protein
MASTRAGRWIQQPTGYKAFVPAPLPPRPPVKFSAELTRLLSDADRAIGRLDGISAILPNPNLFIAMYVRQEAVLSSQIEGTQSTLEDVLAFEAEGESASAPKDVAEVVNYVTAMQRGLARLEDLPLSLRLIREIHEILMHGVRGSEKRPGEFRSSQNWIGAKGCMLRNADFVPPPPHDMNVALGELETFLHEESIAVLIHAGLAHAQFETIHPFLDGNGRIGRLLITFLLCGRGVLRHPLLYLSVYLKAHRAQYYDRLSAIRNDGDWEGWLGFFLRGVAETSNSATTTAHAIMELRESLRARSLPPAAARLRDKLFEHPVLTARAAESLMNVQFATANRALDALEEAGIVREVTGQQRNRRFRFDAFLALFEESGPHLPRKKP